jgi:hypothetical protein
MSRIVIWGRHFLGFLRCGGLDLSGIDPVSFGGCAASGGTRHFLRCLRWPSTGAVGPRSRVEENKIPMARALGENEWGCCVARSRSSRDR